MLRAMNHLHRSRSNPLTNHALSHLSKSRTGIDLGSVVARGIVSSGPEDLAGGACSWPDHVVEVDGVGLLGPDVDFTTEDEVGFVGWDAGEGVVGVDETPVLGWGTVIWEGVEFLEGGTFAEVEPLTLSTIEIL